MLVTNSTNINRLWSRTFRGNKSQRSQKVKSPIYKNYSLVQTADGNKAYVSPEDKTQLFLEDKYSSKASSAFSVQNEKRISRKISEFDSDSDSGYEVPVEKEKPKSCDELNKADRVKTRRTPSFPFLREEVPPGENGRMNLPPHIIPLETSFGPPVAKHKRSSKKEQKRRSSPHEIDPKRGFRDAFPTTSRRRQSDAYESPEDREVRLITEDKEPKRFSVEDGEAVGRPKTVDLELPTEIFPGTQAGKHSRGFSLPEFPVEPPKAKERRSRGGKIDPNPFKKMFAIKRGRKENVEGESDPGGDRRRYGDADLSEVRSDTESADHGSADKSSVSKLTSEKQPKKLMSGLLGSFRKGRNKDKVADNESVRNPSSFEITVKEQPEDVGHGEAIRAEGIVYAELDMARSPGSVMRRDDEKTEYAEIIYPGSKLTVERTTEELRKSRENLTSSRENLTEVDEAFSASSDGKKEAAV